MWPFKKLHPEYIPFPTVDKIQVGLDSYFSTMDSQIVFAYVNDYATGAYGGSYEEGRCQVVIYLTPKRNYIRVVQHMNGKKDAPITATRLFSEGLENEYYRVMMQKKLNCCNTYIITDTLKYEPVKEM